MAARKQKALAQQTKTVERRVFLGIGDAVLRLIHVERQYAEGNDPSEELIAERDLIVQALNQQYQLDLGMDCDEDGIPDAIDPDVSMLTHAAQTSCCRILPDPSTKAPPEEKPVSHVEPLPDPKPKRTSRKKATKAKETSRKKATKPKTEKAPAAKKGFLSSLFGSDEEK
jgi:hypothetical protein